MRHNFQHDSSIAIDDERGYVFSLVKYVLTHNTTMAAGFSTQLPANLNLSYNQSGGRPTDHEGQFGLGDTAGNSSVGAC